MMLVMLLVSSALVLQLLAYSLTLMPSFVKKESSLKNLPELAEAAVAAAAVAAAVATLNN